MNQETGPQFAKCGASSRKTNVVQSRGSVLWTLGEMEHAGFGSGPPLATHHPGSGGHARIAPGASFGHDAGLKSGVAKRSILPLKRHKPCTKIPEHPAKFWFGLELSKRIVQQCRGSFKPQLGAINYACADQEQDWKTSFGNVPAAFFARRGSRLVWY